MLEVLWYNSRLLGGECMQIYHCKKCGFTFSRVGKVETCPDCGKPDIRPALEHEIAEFHSYQQEFEPRSHA